MSRPDDLCELISQRRKKNDAQTDVAFKISIADEGLVFSLVTVGFLHVLLNNVAILGRKLFLDRIVGRIATAIAKSTPGTRWRVLVSLDDGLAISSLGILATLALLLLLILASLLRWLFAGRWFLLARLVAVLTAT